MLLATGKYTYFIRWLLHPSMSNKVQQANRRLEKKKGVLSSTFRPVQCSTQGGRIPNLHALDEHVRDGIVT